MFEAAEKSKNPFFQTEFLDWGQKDGLLDLLGFFGGDFFVFFKRVESQKSKKIKKIDSCKNPMFTFIFSDFWEKSIFFLGFFSFLRKIHLFPWLFWIFDLENQKSKHPFEASKKISKKKPRKSKNPFF